MSSRLCNYLSLWCLRPYPCPAKCFQTIISGRDPSTPWQAHLRRKCLGKSRICWVALFNVVSADTLAIPGSRLSANAKLTLSENAKYWYRYVANRLPQWIFTKWTLLLDGTRDLVRFYGILRSNSWLADCVYGTNQVNIVTMSHPRNLDKISSLWLFEISPPNNVRSNIGILCDAMRSCCCVLGDKWPLHTQHRYINYIFHDLCGAGPPIICCLKFPADEFTGENGVWIRWMLSIIHKENLLNKQVKWSTKNQATTLPQWGTQRRFYSV